MSCSGSYCNSHCYAYGCPAGYRAPRPTFTFNFDVAKTDETALANHLNTVRSAIAQEISDRKLHRNYAELESLSEAVKPIDTVSEASYVNMLRSRINSINGDKIENVDSDIVYEAVHVNEMASAILEIMRDCICYSDCGSNSVCTCYGNCGCYYSDINIKEEIQILSASSII